MTHVAVFLLLFALVMFVGVPEYVSAASPNITVVINGNTTCVNPGPSPLNIAVSNCQGVTIAPISPASGNARVEVIDGSTDLLRMTNAKITANQPNPILTFEKELVQGPNTSSIPTTTNAKYRTSAGGAFTPARNGNSISIQGTIRNPLGATEVSMGQSSYTVTGGIGMFNLGPDVFWPHPPELTGDRKLKYYLTLTLSANDSVTLSTSPMLRFVGTAGDGDIPPELCNMLKAMKKKDLDKEDKELLKQCKKQEKETH